MALGSRLRFIVNRIRERLWVRPLAVCVLSIAGALVAKTADRTQLGEFVPQVTAESLEALLSIMASSMLVIATFAVGSMVSAYASASQDATPRSFTLVIADDVSQNALSTFIGAFIFSIVALTAIKNDYFQAAGRFALFVLTIFVFAMVILTFVRWVDRIARLGRLASSIDKIEQATEQALGHRSAAPNLEGVPVSDDQWRGQEVFGAKVGYVQRVEVPTLQEVAETIGGRIRVIAVPGTFAVPGRPLAAVQIPDDGDGELDLDRVANAFTIGKNRLFDEDPRFGLVVLSEIAGRALSPAINDPGTAIGILGTMARLLIRWSQSTEAAAETICSRVEVPELSVEDMFDDAFTAIARDGAGAVEVAIRLQKTLQDLASLGDPAMRDAARRHARLALARAENKLELEEDLELVRRAAQFAG